MAWSPARGVAVQPQAVRGDSQRLCFTASVLHSVCARQTPPSNTKCNPKGEYLEISSLALYHAPQMPKKTPTRRDPQLALAGSLCVAFVNTAGAREINRQAGAATYAELLSWSLSAGVLPAAEVERLRLRAAEESAEARAVFAWASEFRSALARIFLAVGAGKTATPKDLATVSDAWIATLPAVRLVPDDPGIDFAWNGNHDALDRVLWPVLQSAVDLLRSLDGRPHVRQCAAEKCELFFLDSTRVGKRRWCEMKSCGRRANSLRHYHRSGKKNRPKDWRYRGYL